MSANDSSAHINLLDNSLSVRDSDGQKLPKNPLKRFVSALKRELHEVRTFNSLSLEEIQEINRQKLVADKQRQREHQEKMERKFGTVGLLLAKGAESSGCCATAMTAGMTAGGAGAGARVGGAVRL